MTRTRTKRRSRYNPKSNYNPDARREINPDPRDPAPDGTRFGIVPKRAQAVITYKPAKRPAFCADCGGRDFWQLAGGRWMCSTCQPRTSNNVQDQRAQFLQAGYEPIPLKPNSKDPAAPAWERQLTFAQWTYAAPDANLGLRAGGGHLFIDCDTGHKNSDPETTARVMRWLDGLGYKRGAYPVIETPNKGAHIYAITTAQLLGNYKNFYNEIGTGELRYGAGAYVGTFPSVTPEGQYKLISGDITRPLVLDLQDIRTLIDIDQQQQQPDKKPGMTRLARRLLSGDETTIKEQYQGDRSAAEAGLVLSLVQSGYTYSAIKAIFQKYKCAGHYSDPDKYKTEAARNAYLYRTYQNALIFAQRESDTRRLWAQVRDLARIAAWNKPTDRNVFIEHANIGYRVGQFSYDAGMRDLALGAGVSLATASKATQRLIGEKIISLTKSGAGVYANGYTLQTSHALLLLAERSKHIHLTPREDVFTLGHFSPEELQKLAQHDAFRNGYGNKYTRKKDRLGRHAGVIYERLARAPMDEKQISEVTGISLKTVRKKLAAMAKIKDHKTGEIISMVEREGDLWHACRVDLDLICAIKDTYGARGKQAKQYAQERRAHAKALELHALQRERGGNEENL